MLSAYITNNAWRETRIYEMEQIHVACGKTPAALFVFDGICGGIVCGVFRTGNSVKPCGNAGWGHVISHEIYDRGQQYPVLVRAVQKMSEFSGAYYHGNDLSGMDFLRTFFWVRQCLGMESRGSFWGSWASFPIICVTCRLWSCYSDGVKICTGVFIFTITQPGREKNPCPADWENWRSYGSHWSSDVYWNVLWILRY